MTSIILPYHISHKFIVSNPQWIFVYGCDILNKSFFGQAYACGNEPNTFGVPTMHKYCASGPKYFHDESYGIWKPRIDEAIDRIDTTKPVIVFRRIGEGCSNMKAMAPGLFEYMKGRLKEIEYPNYSFDHAGLVYPLYKI